MPSRKLQKLFSHVFLSIEVAPSMIVRNEHKVQLAKFLLKNPLGSGIQIYHNAKLYFSFFFFILLRWMSLRQESIHCCHWRPKLFLQIHQFKLTLEILHKLVMRANSYVGAIGALFQVWLPFLPTRIVLSSWVVLSRYRWSVYLNDWEIISTIRDVLLHSSVAW